MGAAAHWGVWMPSWWGPVNEQEIVISERFRSWTGKMRRREAVIRAFGWVGQASAQGGQHRTRRGSRRRMLEAVGLPTDALIELESRRRFEGRFTLPSGLTGGLIPVEGLCLGWRTGR